MKFYYIKDLIIKTQSRKNATFPLRSVIHISTYQPKTYEMSVDHTVRVTPVNVKELCTQQILPRCVQTVLVVYVMEDSDGTCLWLSVSTGKKQYSIYTKINSSNIDINTHKMKLALC